MFNLILRLFTFLTFLLFASCKGGTTKAELIPVEDFFVKSERSSFKLSPDGSKIAYLGVDNHCKNIFVLDLENKKNSKQLTYQGDVNVQYFFWTSDSSMVYANAFSSTDSLRIFAIDVATEESVALFPLKKARLRWIYPNKVYDNYLLASINLRDSTVFDLYKVFVDGRAPELVTTNPGNISNWFASADGEVRLAVTSDSVQERLLYRPSNEEEFRQVATLDYQTMIRPLGFKKNSLTEVYALSNEGRDKLALVEYDLSEGRERKLIFSHENVDLGTSWYSNSTQELIFSEYTVDKGEKRFFDKDFQSDFEKLQKKFEDQSIDVLNTDTSLKNWIVKVYTDINAGGIYHYNTDKNQIELLTELNPKLSTVNLRKKHPINFLSRDGLKLHGYLTYPRGDLKKNLPVVVLVHDGPYYRESVEFDAEAQFLADRGYLVFQINYRGSAGYGKKFWSAGFKEWGGKIQLDIMDGVTWLIHQGIADKNRVAIMGSGFGGYSALYAATYNSSFYRCSISMSGYTNLFTYFKEIPPYQQQYINLFYKTIGNPIEEYEMFKAVSPLFHADRVRIPVLFAQGGSDRYSSLTDANQFVQKVKNNNVPVKYIYHEDEGRRFRSDENIVNYYQEVELFLKTYLN